MKITGYTKNDPPADWAEIQDWLEQCADYEDVLAMSRDSEEYVLLHRAREEAFRWLARSIGD